MRYASGNTYEGHWQEDRKHGFGVMIWRDMDETYIGEWIDDLPNGYGEHIWGDSNAKTVKKQSCNIYRGEFQQGQRHGRGTFFYMNGASYSGYWQEDAKHGPGVFVHPDGKIIVGDYVNNHLINVSSPGSPTTNNNNNANSPSNKTALTNGTNVTTSVTKGASKPGSAKAGTTSVPASANGTKKPPAGSTAAPSIATKLPSIPEGSTASNLAGGASNVPVPPSTANVNASSTHPNNISVQYHLHILDVLAKFPVHPRILDVDHHSPSMLTGTGTGTATVTAVAGLSSGTKNNGVTGVPLTLTAGTSTMGVVGSVEYAKTLHERQSMMYEMERVLLKYNTHIKQIYRRFNEQANRLRQREAVVITPLPNGVPAYSPAEKTWKMRKAALQARAFQRRVHCASLRDAMQFLREIGILNGQEITAYDVTQCFRTMKRHHERCAIEQYRTYLQQIQALEEESAMLALEAEQQQQLAQAQAVFANENGGGSRYSSSRRLPSGGGASFSAPPTPLQSTTDLAAPTSLSIHDIESEEEYTARHRREQYAKAMAIKAKIQEAALAMGQLMDDYLLFDDDPVRFDIEIDEATWAAEGFKAFPSSSEASASFYRATIGQQPLLEHEFVELFVRVVLEYALRHGYRPNSITPNVPESTSSSSSSVPCWAWMTPYQVLEHILAERVYPLANQGPQHVTDVIHDLYDDTVQDLFHQRPNKLLDAAFSPSTLAALYPHLAPSIPAAEAAMTMTNGGADAPSSSSVVDSAQTFMLAQWEAAKRFAIEQQALNDEELYAVPIVGAVGWIRLRDFVTWFIATNPSLPAEGDAAGAAVEDPAAALESMALAQRNYVSLRPTVTQDDLLRLLCTDSHSLPVAPAAAANDPAAMTDAGPTAVVAGAVDATIVARKMVYEDFAEALVRIWSRSDKEFIRVVNPLFATAAAAAAAGTAGGVDGGEVKMESSPTGLSEGFIDGAGGWLDVGSSVSSSVLGNQLLHRLLLWLLSRRPLENASSSVSHRE